MGNRLLQQMLSLERIQYVNLNLACDWPSSVVSATRNSFLMSVGARRVEIVYCIEFSHHVTLFPFAPLGEDVLRMTTGVDSGS